MIIIAQHALHSPEYHSILALPAILNWRLEVIELGKCPSSQLFQQKIRSEENNTEWEYTITLRHVTTPTTLQWRGNEHKMKGLSHHRATTEVQHTQWKAATIGIASSQHQHMYITMTWHITSPSNIIHIYIQQYCMNVISSPAVPIWTASRAGRHKQRTYETSLRSWDRTIRRKCMMQHKITHAPIEGWRPHQEKQWSIF